MKLIINRDNNYLFLWYNFYGDIMNNLKESKEFRKKRVNSTIRTYTKIIMPKKGKKSYDRKKNNKDFQ